MKLHIHPYVRPFLVSGLIFGMLNGIWDYTHNGTVSWGKIIFMTVGFGALTAWSELAGRKHKTKP